MKTYKTETVYNGILHKTKKKCHMLKENTTNLSVYLNAQ